MASKNRKFVVGLLVAASYAFVPQAYGAGVSSTTTLAVSSSSVPAGTPITFTATVTKTVSVGPVTSPVTSGEVIFCDATAAHCDGEAVFGTAQLTSAGTAAIKLTLGVGSYNIQANFQGTSAAPASASTAQAVTVSGNTNYLTITAIASSGSAGDYTLTGTVTAFGKPALTGIVSFLDASNADASISSATPDPSTLTPGFSSSTPATELSRLQTVFSGDFNNDGIPDLAVITGVGIVAGNVAIYLGRGDGTFLPPTNYTLGNAPLSVAIADVNGDGNVDLIVTNQNGSNVSILLGKGDGTFNPQVTYSTGTEPHSVAVGDFNGDGNLDLAVANTIDGTVSILLGNGDGTFQTQVTHSVHSAPEGIVAGHFSNSGHWDLAVTDLNGSTPNVGVLLGNGDGTFQSEQNNALPVITNGEWLAAGDLRRNGTTDLVVPDASTTNVYVLLGNNDGTFEVPVAYPVAQQPFSVALGDVNGDGILDLVVPDTGADGLVSVLLGHGDGTFAAKTDYTVGNNPTNVALADFNGDGLLDLASSNPGSGSVTVLLQDRSETATATGVVVDGAGTHNVVAAYPGDDVFASSVSLSVPLAVSIVTTTSTILMASPNPATPGQLVTFTATVSPAPSGPPFGSVNFFSGAMLLGSATLNSSGVATFSTALLSLGITVVSATYSGNSTFGTSTSVTISENVKSTTQTTTSLTLSSSSVTAGSPVTLTAAVNAGRGGVSPGTVTFCDASATRCEDTAILGVAQLTSGGTAAIKLTLGVGSYSFDAIFTGDNTVLGSTSSPQNLTVTGKGGYPTVATISATGGVGDYSLTGSVAAFGTAPLTGNLSFLDTSNSNAVVATASLAALPPTYGFVSATGSPLNEGDTPENVVAADFNNDGIPDLAVVDDDNATVDIFIGNGDGTFQSGVSYPIATTGVALAVGDFNGDGKLDIVTANAVSNVKIVEKVPPGTISVLLGNGDGTFQPQTSYTAGNTPAAVSVGDFNNDGILDLAVANTATPGTGTISIFLGKGDGTFTAPGENLTLADPNGPSFIAVGDFNNDGIADLAVSDLGGTVSVFLGNGNGTFQPLVSYAAGTMPDYIVAADLNKDGKPDLVAANYADNTVSVFIGNGDGTFQPQVTYATGSGPNALAIGDFNNDGKLDLAIADDNDTTISILYGNGDGTFQAPLVDNLAGQYPWGIVASDFNGDGLTDLAVTNIFDGTVSVLLNQQIASATAAGVSVLGAGVHNVLASYPGDASRASSQSSTVPLQGTPLIVTSTVLVAAPSPATFGEPVTFTATVTPEPTGSTLGTVSFYNGKTLLGTGVLNSSGVATFSTTKLPGGEDDLTAVYSGNLTSATSTSADVPETVNAIYAVTAPATPFLVPQGGSVMVNVNVPPVGGAFNNLVTLSATGLPAGATATFNPASVTPGASGAPTVLTIQLFVPSSASASAATPRRVPIVPLGAAAFCCVGIAFLGSRRKILKRSLAFGGLLAVAAFLVSCNGGFAGKPGTLPGSYTVTVTGTSGSLHFSTTITLTVQ